MRSLIKVQLDAPQAHVAPGMSSKLLLMALWPISVECGIRINQITHACFTELLVLQLAVQEPVRVSTDSKPTCPYNRTLSKVQLPLAVPAELEGCMQFCIESSHPVPTLNRAQSESSLKIFITSRLCATQCLGIKAHIHARESAWCAYKHQQHLCWDLAEFQHMMTSGDMRGFQQSAPTSGRSDSSSLRIRPTFLLCIACAIHFRHFLCFGIVCAGLDGMCVFICISRLFMSRPDAAMKLTSPVLVRPLPSKIRRTAHMHSCGQQL